MTHPANETLVQMCQELATRESAYLEAMLANLETVRSAVTAAEPECLVTALHPARAATAALSDLRQQRQQFRERAGSLLGVPAETVTLGQVANALPAALAEPVRQQRQRLRQLAVEVDRINQANALVIWWRLDFIQQVFAGIPALACTTRYSPDGGRLQAAACGSLCQEKG
jgi:hypothetical protein